MIHGTYAYAENDVFVRIDERACMRARARVCVCSRDRDRTTIGSNRSNTLMSEEIDNDANQEFYFRYELESLRVRRR